MTDPIEATTAPEQQPVQAQPFQPVPPPPVKWWQVNYAMSGTQKRTLAVSTITMAFIYGMNHFDQPPVEKAVTSAVFGLFIEAERQVCMIPSLFSQKRIALLAGFALFGVGLLMPRLMNGTKYAALESEKAIFTPVNWVDKKIDQQTPKLK